MSFKDRLRKATYGGAPFFVDTVTVTSGRAVKVHSFSSGNTSGPSPIERLRAKQRGVSEDIASSEFPFVEDLGRKARIIQVECYFLEGLEMPDYIQARDTFIEICEQKGEDILQLPTWEPFNASVGEIKTTFNNKEGGIERVSITFYRSVKNIQPSSVVDTEREVETKVAEAKQAIIDTFYVNFSVNENTDPEVPDDYGTAKFVAEDTRNAFEKFADKMKEYASYANTIQSEVNGYVQTINGYVNDLVTLIETPEQLVSETLAIIEQCSSIFTRPFDAFNAQLNMFETFPDQLDEIVGTTLDKLQLGRNNKSLKATVKNACLSQMSLVAKDIDFANAAQAGEVRDLIAEKGEEVQLENGEEYGDHKIYGTISRMLSASIIDLTERSSVLPFIETVRTVKNIPLLVMAYGLYGDAERFQELQERNEVRNNLFPPLELEVLSE